MLLRKTLKLNDVELKMDGDTGKFAGYASVFGGVDSQGDTIMKGAFVQTLAKSKPKMFFNHEWTMPIGKYAVAKEDDKGLYVEGELTPGLGLAVDVRAAMKHGTLDGLSVGGMLRRGDYEETDKGRIIHKWSELLEVSPVVFPADGAARIDMASVKSMDFAVLLPECETERDIERLLRDAGLGKGEATALVSRARVIFQGRDAQEEASAKAMADLVKRVNRLAGIET
jgi:HK97 family phage prohead protease